jgi:adenine-specific DNA-methyltransferase
MSEKYIHLSKEELLRLVEKQESELKNKKYGLYWDGEREPEQVVLDCEDNLPVLERIEGREVKTDDSDDNILIEGDNYHALTVLNYTHKESVDLIYIDPPYNTGKSGEWKYNDKYVDENDGYRHSKWLNFLEKRLILAKKILRETGSIFISIDDNEFSQLKLLCDKVFSPKNFIANVVVKSNPRGKQQMKVAGVHEYLLVYAKNIEKLEFEQETLGKSRIAEYSKTDESGKRYREIGLRKRGADSLRDDVPNLYYPIYINPNTGEVSLKKNNSFTKKAVPVLSNGVEGRWRWGKSKFQQFKNRLYGRLVNGKRWDVFEKDYLKIEGEIKGQKYKTIWDEKEINYEKAKATLRELFNGESPFDYPKTVYIIKKIIGMCVEKDSVILDFFAGSGTTGQAVLELNKEDGGSRKFILCTNNEISTDDENKFKKEYDLNDLEFKKWQKDNKKEWLNFQEEKGICSAVCYPRVRKVIEGYDYEGKEKELVWEKKFTLNTLRWGKAEEVYQEYKDKREEIKEEYGDYESSFENNIIRLYGVKEIKGRKKGLGGNLQYFKTEFIKRTKNSDQLKLNLTQKCTQMLCVKDNIYNLEKEGKDYKIFSSNKKDKYLCVYYNFIDNSFNYFLNDLGKIKEDKKIYMFSINNEVDKSLFESLLINF